MAFGGYKFKGYKVVRANLATDTYANWCLLVHQARIKAFMESCALSGAQWHFSKTNGPLAFEDYGNVIYRVANGNGEYHDYLSFFQYGDENLYYMISTLGEYYSPSTSGTPDLLSASRYCGTGNYTASNRKYKFMSFSSALSLSQFSDTGPFSGGSWPTSALACSSQFCDYEDTDANWGRVNSIATHSSIVGLTTVRIGCTTKGKDIIWFFGSNYNKCCIESGDAFANISSPGDEYGLLKLVLCGGTSESTDPTITAGTRLLNYSNAECLASDGTRSFSTNNSSSTESSRYSNLTILPPYDTIFTPGTQMIPYSAATLSTLNINYKLINPYGIASKGVIKPELLSLNSYLYDYRNNVPTINSATLGGNMICKVISNYPNATGSVDLTPIHNLPMLYTRPMFPGYAASPASRSDLIGVVAYVGWDPSNPDITNEASWQELALQ